MLRSGGGTPGPAGPPGAAGAPGTPGQTIGNALIDGGGVVHSTNLDVVVSAAEYQIYDVAYTSPQTTLTIGTADPTNPRIDVIALNTSGAAVVVAGVAAATPFEPVLDPGSQLRLTAFTIAAGATSLTTANTIIFTEGGGESWTETASGAPVNVASTSSPITGSVSVEVTAGVNGNYAEFANGSDFDTTTRNILALTIKSKATWSTQKSLVLRWYDGTIARGTAVAIRTGAYGFNSSDTTTEQQIVIPMQAFGVAGLAVDTLRATITGGGGSIGFWLDDVYMQAGVQQGSQADALRFRGTYSAAVQYQLDDVVISGSRLWRADITLLGVTPGGAGWTALAMLNPMTAGGDLIYGGASGLPTRLANGTAGYALISAGGTSAPVWEIVRDIPQNSKSAAYTTVLADAGKHLLHPAADTNARTFTIDSNANVAYPIGTAITFVNETANVLSIAITSDTLTLANTTTSGTRSLAQNGVATALKVTSTKWIISGTGLT